MSRPDRLLLAAGLVYGLALAVVTPPFQVPDEVNHFARAWRVSEGRLDLAPVTDPFVELPAGAAAVTAIGADLPFHPERRIAPAAIRTGFRIPLDPGRRVRVYAPGGLQYTFVPYVPQALAIAAGRLCGAGPLALLYLARLGNLLFGTLALAAAVRRLPAYRWLAALLLLSPMAVALRASASADVTSTAAAFLLAATVARRAWGEREEPAGAGEWALVTAAAAVLGLSKLAYAPLALFVLAIPPARRPRGRRAYLLLPIGAAALAFAVSVHHAYRLPPMYPGVDSHAQLRAVLAHPALLPAVAAKDWLLHAPRYLAQMVGKLGWLDVPLPPAFLAADLAALAALLALDAGPGVDVRPRQRALAAALPAACMALITAALYVSSTPLGAREVLGIQGRYLIPLVPFAVWALHGRRLAGRVPETRRGAAVAALTLVGLLAAVRALLARYYGA